VSGCETAAVELRDAVRRRRMVRAFEARPVDPALVDSLLDLARRAPSAGNTAEARAFVVLEGAQTSAFWERSLPPDRRPGFRWKGLLDAPVIVLPLVRPAAYVERYSAPDKAATGLGAAENRWPVPYWWVDGGAGVEAILLGAVDAGLGALFFGLFEREGAILDALGVPKGWRALGAVALGWPATDVPGTSAHRPRPPLDDLVHRGHW
jgi:nitroreductase